MPPIGPAFEIVFKILQKVDEKMQFRLINFYDFLVVVRIKFRINFSQFLCCGFKKLLTFF